MNKKYTSNYFAIHKQTKFKKKNKIVNFNLFPTKKDVFFYLVLLTNDENTPNAKKTLTRKNYANI